MRLKPNINNLKLTRRIKGFDQDLNVTEIDVIEEKPLTLYLNSQEIVTMMTINDYPEYLAVGYLLNQNMLTILLITLLKGPMCQFIVSFHKSILS